MAVSLRVTGTWAELTADGAVAIPATPQAGDRMFLFARWKDFSITAQVTSPVAWTEITEFADGAVTAGNGTGSVKVGCWYRDWQSGDTNPTLDFSASPDNASVVIMVMQKAADDVWGTPVARTAAMTNWTTTSQIVSASSSVSVPSGSAVMGLIGIRDDTAVMTRPTSGIDDSTGAITWNGDYVKSPATHHSTTTGFDGAADLGYRLVSIGATATLRMTGTISAAETGSALWVIQDTTIVVTPTPGSLTISAFVPALKRSVIPAAAAALTLAAFVPTLKTAVTPVSRSVLCFPFYVPTIATGVIPPTATLSVGSFAPTFAQGVIPQTVSLTLTTFAPTELDIPGTLSLTITTYAPTIYPIPPVPIVYLDPGGDAVQVTGYFGTVSGSGAMSFDSSQQVAGVGSWKFDSGAGNDTVEHKIANVLGQARRASAYFRYGSLLNTDAVAEGFPDAISDYPDPLVDTGFSGSVAELQADDEQYATATPAKNGWKASIVSGFHSSLIPINSIIDSVKIVYERKYDVNTSIGISRVFWAIGVDVESLTEIGPNHDNTDMPTTDTVVEVDITHERTWERADFDSLLIIAEARRGDSDTAHTQSWDYVKLEVAYHTAIDILAGRSATEDALKLAVLPVSTGAVLRVVNIGESGIEGAVFDGNTILLPDEDYRITLSYFQNGTDDLDVKIFVDGVEELTVLGAITNGKEIGTWPDLFYGWLGAPGANQVCWFDQIYIDEGDDLTDPGNILMTAKLPASVNVNNFDTTTGTGAVDERPVNTANLKRHNASSQVFQNYTLQTAAVGDVDLSSETQVGYMGWVIIARGTGSSTGAGITLNGTTTTVNLAGLANFTPTFFKAAITGSAYPSNAAGIGMRSNTGVGSQDLLLYECGVIVAYEGPTPDVLLPNQLIVESVTTTASDDMGGTPPAEYELRSQTAENPDAVVTTIIYATPEGEVPQQHVVIESQGGDETGMVTFNPGAEVIVSVTVAGDDATIDLRRSLNNQ